MSQINFLHPPHPLHSQISKYGKLSFTTENLRKSLGLILPSPTLPPTPSEPNKFSDPRIDNSTFLVCKRYAFRHHNFLLNSNLQYIFCMFKSLERYRRLPTSSQFSLHLGIILVSHTFAKKYFSSCVHRTSHYSTHTLKSNVFERVSVTVLYANFCRLPGRKIWWFIAYVCGKLTKSVSKSINEMLKNHKIPKNIFLQMYSPPEKENAQKQTGVGGAGSQ